MPPPIPVNMPRRADVIGLNPSVIAFCAPATAKNDSPTASRRSTGLRSRSTPAYEKKVMSPGHDGNYQVSYIGKGGRWRGADQHIAADPTKISGHERQDEDTENVEPTIDRGNRPADRENEGAPQVKNMH